MGNVWIIKDDDSKQCDQTNEHTSVEEMQKELEALGVTVISAEKRQDCRAIIAMCGAPTGRVNAYEISEEDWANIESGIVGPNGFREWDCDDKGHTLNGGEVPWPLLRKIAANTTAHTTPVLVRDLIGRVSRVYEVGDVLTQDYRPERVNIELVQGSTIINDIWFG